MSPSPGEVEGCSWGPVASCDTPHDRVNIDACSQRVQEYLPIVTNLMLGLPAFFLPLIVSQRKR